MNALRRVLGAAGREDGFTLAELLIVSLLLPLVIFAVGMLYIGTLNTEKTVNAVTSTTNTTQAAVTSMVHGVRYATEVDLAGSNKVLIARIATSTGTGTWHCVAWYYDSTGSGKIWTKAYADNTAGIATAAVAHTGWSVLMSKVTPRTGTSVFSTASNAITIAMYAQTTDEPSFTVQVTAQRIVPLEMETAKCS